MLIFTAFAIIMLQPDLGTGVVLVLTCMLMIFIAGGQLRYFIGIGMMGLIGFVGLILSAPYRISRITAFMNPWEDPLGDGFQIIQSLYAIGPGGLMGVGLGNSLQKRSEEHTSELQSRGHLVCRLLLAKKKIRNHNC